MRISSAPFALMLAALALAVPAPSRAIQVGDVAPDFTLQDVDGTAHRLADLRGNVVLLAFIGYG